MYWCITMHSVLTFIDKYQFIDMYRCVLIDEFFSAIGKTLKLTFYRK